MRLLVYQVHPSLTDLIKPEMNGRALVGQGACPEKLKNSHCVKSERLSSRLKPRRVTRIPQLILR